jgi:hypothetical protein
MRKFVIGLLTLVIYTTVMVAIPVISPASAATDGTRHAKKHKKHIQQGPSVSKSQNQGYPPEDPDRKAAAGGY